MCSYMPDGKSIEAYTEYGPAARTSLRRQLRRRPFSSPERRNSCIEEVDKCGCCVHRGFTFVRRAYNCTRTIRDGTAPFSMVRPTHNPALFPFPLFVPLPLPPHSLSITGSYGNVSREVLAETATTANDPYKQFAISFFDNKFNSLIPLKIAYWLR